MAYDQMGNYYDDETLTEEERRRLSQTGSLAPVVPGQKTYVNLANSRGAGVPYQAPVAPVAPDTYTAQQESGGNYNIGYHFKPNEQGTRQSSAYGAYGITAPAYKDIQAANPAFAGRDITSLTPEEQDQAQATYKQVLGKQLQALNVQPTEENLRGAHFLGAKGLSDYLQTGAISPAAAAANGGEENVRKIIQGRLAAQPSPSSGAAQPAVPSAAVAPSTAPVATQPAVPVQPSIQTDDEGNQLITTATGQTYAVGPDGRPLANRGINMPEAAKFDPFAQRLLDNANNTEQLLALGADTNAPAWVRQMAQEKGVERFNFTKQQEEYKKRLEEQIKNNDTVGIARDISKKDAGGSWARAVIFGLLGGSHLANEELAKLGYGSQLQKTTYNGQEVVFDQTPLGNPVMGSGRYATGPMAGQRLSDDELTNAAAGTGGAGGKVLHVDTGLVDNLTNVGGYQRITYANGREVIKDAAGNIVTDPKIKENIRKVGVEGTLAEQAESQRVKAAYAKLAKTYSMPTEQQKYQALVDAGVPPKRIESELGLPPGSLGGQRPAVSPTAPQAPKATVSDVKAANTADQVSSGKINMFAEPVQKVGEADAVFKTRLEDWKKQRGLAEKNAEEFRNKRVEIKNQLENIAEIREIVKSGNYNLGPSLGFGAAGPLPGVQQAVGGVFGTTDYDNTLRVKSLINRDGLNGIKNSMGPAISNFDVQQWMKDNPIKENSSQDALLKYIDKLYKDMYEAAEAKRKSAVELGMLESDFSLGARPDDIKQDSNPKSKAQQELERRRKER